MAGNQRNSILCPGCRRLISASEPRCPYCGLGRPAAWWKNNAWTRSLNNPDRLIKAVIALNAGMYVIALLFNLRAVRLSFNPLTFLSPSDPSLLILGATGTIPIDRFHRWWTLLAASYLHGGILHIFFNMVAFKQLATIAVREYGTSRLVIIYTLAGIAGFLVSYLMGVPLTIGASAAVCGLIGALLYYGKSRGGVYGRALYRQIGGWVVFIFLFGLLVPGINNWGHGGGILAGIVLGFGLGYQERKKENPGHRMLAAGCAAVTLAVLAWAVGTGLFYRLAA